MNDKQISDKRLDEIETRCNAATPGPWTDRETGYSKTGRAGGECYHEVLFPLGLDDYWQGRIDIHLNAEDAAFIAHARDDVPYLAAEVRRLRVENGKLRQVLEFYSDPEIYSLGGLKERDAMPALAQMARDYHYEGIDSWISKHKRTP